MRLSKLEIKIIKETATIIFGSDTKVFLFGSRINDKLKGGDIDIYIETNNTIDVLNKKIKMLIELKKILGERRIDLVINNFQSYKHIFTIAKQEGILL
jgi:predicted nucleotidyltransferase